jgi:hydrogenase maturation protease
VVDFGIRGLDLVYTLLDPYEAVILVDAMPRGGRPGTLYVLEPEPESDHLQTETAPLLEPHSMDPTRVLRLVSTLGGQVKRLLVVGCEPGTGGDEDGLGEMTAPVRAAVDEAVLLIESLVARLLCSMKGSEAATMVCEENTIPGKEVSTCHPLDHKA